MPRIKRWFPVSHDINKDPEMWDLCDRFGDKALRCWLELLSIADRNEGEIPGQLESISTSVSWAIRCRTTKTKKIIENMVSIGWLNISQVATRQQLDENSTATRRELDENSTEFQNKLDKCLKVSNYLKYHPTRDDKKPPLESLPSEPSEPSEPNIKNNTPIVPKGDDGFESFWKTYPKRVGRGAAEKAWKRLKPNTETVQAIIKAIGEQKESANWQKDLGQFVPYPATWLNQKRWQDDPQIENSEPEDPTWGNLLSPKTQAE